MRIALIHYRLLQKGGLERRLLNYYRYFHERGHEVHIFAAKRDPKLELPAGVHYQKVVIKPFPKRFRRWAFARKIGQMNLTDQFDRTLSLGRTFGQTAAIDGGGHYGYMKGLGIQRKSLKDRLHLHMDELTFETSEVIYACSGMVRDFAIEGHGVNPDKIKVIYPPLNVEQFNQDLQPERATLREEFGIRDDKTTFLFMSTGHKMKNLKFVLELFRALDSSRYELLLVGIPPKTALPDNVRYLGYIRQPERIYTAVDCTIHPALYEPYGQVIAESVQCGTPVMVSANVGAKEVITEHEGVIVNSFELADWVEQLDALEHREFDISPTFAHDRRLTLEDHMERIMAFYPVGY